MEAYFAAGPNTECMHVLDYQVDLSACAVVLDNSSGAKNWMLATFKPWSKTEDSFPLSSYPGFTYYEEVGSRMKLADTLQGAIDSLLSKSSASSSTSPQSQKRDAVSSHQQAGSNQKKPAASVPVPDGLTAICKNVLLSGRKDRIVREKLQHVALTYSFYDEQPPSREPKPQENERQIFVNDTDVLDKGELMEAALRKYIPEIAACYKANKVVHLQCGEGKSRSVTFAVMVVALIHGWSIHHAHAYVMEQRPIVSIRKVFLEVLQKLENDPNLRALEWK